MTAVQFTEWEPAWGGILRRFPADNVPEMTQGFQIIRSEIDDLGRETVLEWEAVGPPLRTPETTGEDA